MYPDPYDLRLVTHHGELHGCCDRIVHISEMYALIADLEKRGLKVVKVAKLGWIDQPSHPLTTAQWHEAKRHEDF